MIKRFTVSLGLCLLFVLAISGTAYASSPAQAFASGEAASIALVALTFLLPAGLILLSVAAFAEDEAVGAATGAMVVWGLSVAAFLAFGFAFQFGGIAVVDNRPDLAGLYWEYSLLDVSWGTGWGMIGLKGFLLQNDANTPLAMAIFLSQLPLLGVATLIPYFALWGRARRWVMVVTALLVGGLVYPIIGNWTWGGGWLANLGGNLDLGHGMVDAAGGGQVVLAGAVVALAALVVHRRKKPRSSVDIYTTTNTNTYQTSPLIEPSGQTSLSTPMPPIHLPVLGWLGAVLLVIGWIGTCSLTHLPTAVNISPAVMATNLVLGAFGGSLAASLYGWFTTGKPDVLMSARGMVAGLVVTAAGAPFMPAWTCLVWGMVVGLLVPVLVHVLDHRLRLSDTSAAIATFGVPSLLGLLLPGLLADGRYGQGWNGVGTNTFLGVPDQGVSGLFVLPNMAADWPGQLNAQLVSLVVILLWSFGLSWLVLRGMTGLIHTWERSRRVSQGPPKPVEVQAAPAESTQPDRLSDEAAEIPSELEEEPDVEGVLSEETEV